MLGGTPLPEPKVGGSALGVFARGALQGMAAGAVGVAAMTLAEKLEQGISGRPDSHVPARTLERLLGLPESPNEQPRSLNLLMHFGQGVLLGALRGIMANGGLRGPWSSAMFTVVRLTNDQTLETQPESARRRGRGRAESSRSTSRTRPCTPSPPVLSLTSSQDGLVGRVRSTPGSGLAATRT